MPVTSREVHLVSRPEGQPLRDCFTLATTPVTKPGPGQVLVRNTWLSVDPYMRSRMDDRRSYVPPFELDAPLGGGAVGVVEASEHESVKVGDTVLHGKGWREYALLEGDRVRPLDTSVAPPQAYLGILGMPGLTAYAGLVDVAAFQPGDAVFVSAAAGAVGSIAGQVARLKGASRVVGSAGSPEKVAWLTGDAGFEAAFNYHDGPVRALLKEAAPDGVDVYFDNVGGEHLEAAISRLRVRGRIAICGMISQYDAPEPPPGPRNLVAFIGKRLTMRGFLVQDHGHLREQFLREVGPWYAERKIAWRETVVDGIENAVDAFVGLLAGANVGKMLVRLP